MSLIEEARKRLKEIRKEPILPILRTKPLPTPQVRRLPDVLPSEFQVTYISPRKRR